MPINFDLIEPAVLTGYVRDVPFPANFTLSTWLPNQNIGDIEAAFTTLERVNRTAMYRAYDAETPIGKRDSFSRKRISLPPLGQKTVVGEEERLRLAAIQSGGDNTVALINAIYDDAEINTRAIYARMELARGQVLTTHKFTLSGENQLQGIEADFGVDNSHRPTASTLWSDHTNSNPLEDLRTWVDLVTDDGGEVPAYMLTSRQVVGNLLRNVNVRNLVSSLAGTPTMVTRTQLASVLDAWDLPQLVQYDTQVSVAGSSTRVIPANRVILLPANPASLGRTFWGTTAEALELVGGTNPQLTFSEAPGLVGMVMKEGDPVRTWTKVTAIGMPVITDPKRILTAQVLA